MRRKVSIVLVPLSLLSLAGLLSAGDAEFLYPEYDSLPGTRVSYHSGKQWPLAPRPCLPPEPCIHRYHTAHYWPDPYRWQDRTSVRCYIAAQAAAGWMTNTTLYDQHFDPETQELNDSGRVHLKWILLYAPPHRRTPWVQTGDSVEMSQTRLASVQAEALAMVGSDCVPPIMLRICQPYGASAQEVDLVRRAYLATIPAPRISYTPQNGSSSGGGSSSGSSSGGGGGSPQGGR
ncbi:MAG TPA: hypothetical protein VGH74_14500 [Planctomycetaceae bacterium]